MSIRTLLVDNDTIYRSAVRCIFDQVDDVTVVGEARVTESLVPILARVNPDVVVVGVPADVGAGFTATLDIRVNAPGAGIVVLAGRADPRLEMAVGARGYLTKDCEVDALVSAVRGAHVVPTYSKSVVGESLLRSEHEPAYDQVRPTAWERQVIALIAAGYKHKEIAARLGSSYRAIQGCHARIRHEMRLESRAEIVEYAAREGLLNLPA